MTDTSGPTREAIGLASKIYEDAPEALFDAGECHAWVNATALAIDAHTQALREENALLRDRLRLAVEARKAWYVCADTATDTDGYVALRDSAIDADEALRASGVEI